MYEIKTSVLPIWPPFWDPPFDSSYVGLFDLFAPDAGDEMFHEIRDVL